MRMANNYDYNLNNIKIIKANMKFDAAVKPDLFH